MYRLFLNKHAVTCAAIVAMSCSTAGLSSAQDQNDAMQEVEESTLIAVDEIIVEAPIRHRKEQSLASPTTKVEIIQLTRRVSFADLDLTKAEDVKTLKLRIERIAKDSCRKLSKLYPLSTSRVTERKRCAKAAIKESEKHLDVAIEEAK
ncbi:MAG: UrcA family protein [Hyphomonadaceae bacterium]|nr:UrcA family protein [Hyphomonadaceae bacterium]